MIGFLLGAGFSKAIHDDMPVTAELLAMLEAADKIPDYVPPSIRTDLEKTLSFLWTNYPWHTEIEVLRNRADYFRLTKEIHWVLADKEVSAWNNILTLGDAVVREMWPAKLAQVMSNNSHSVVLTMNYDTLLERFMIVANSRNWLLYPAPIQRLYGAWNQRREDLVVRGITGNQSFAPMLFKLHGSLSWYSLDPLDSSNVVYGLDMDQYYVVQQDRIPSDFGGGTLSPVIVPPVADKSSLYSNKVMRAQWTGAAEMLSRCDELYCIGYSFPKSDLAMQLFLSQAAARIRAVHLVDPYGTIALHNRAREIFGTNTHIEDHFESGCVMNAALHIAAAYGV